MMRRNPRCLIGRAVCGVIIAALCALCAAFTVPTAEAATSFSGTCTFLWNANTESDLAGYRAWVSKGGVQKPVVNVPVSTAPKVTCQALGVDSDGTWDFNVLAYDNAQTANLSSVSSIQATRDTVAPNTTIAQTITGSGASFALTSNETNVTFECALDSATFSQCTTPKAYTGLADGPHVFAARAKDAAGNVDASAAQFSWSVNVQPPGQPAGLDVQPVDLTVTPNP